MSNKYPECWARGQCAKLYGYPISDRTWRKYKSICRVPDGRKNPRGNLPMIEKTYCQRLFMLAYMRMEQRRGDKHPAGWQSKITLKQIITRLNQAKGDELDKLMGDTVIIDGRLGKDVPVWISQTLGRTVSLRTLRRWARKHELEFHSHLPVPVTTLNLFLQLA